MEWLQVSTVLILCSSSGCPMFSLAEKNEGFFVIRNLHVWYMMMHTSPFDVMVIICHQNKIPEIYHLFFILYNDAPISVNWTSNLNPLSSKYCEFYYITCLTKMVQSSHIQL